MVVVFTKWSRYTSVVVHCNPADTRVIFNSSLVALFNDTNTFCLHSEKEHVLTASFNLFTHLGIYVWSANDLETSFLHAPHTGLSAETFKLKTKLRASSFFQDVGEENCV